MQDRAVNQCRDLTRTPRGWLQCRLEAGHDVDPLSMHWVIPGEDLVLVKLNAEQKAWEQGFRAGQRAAAGAPVEKNPYPFVP